MPRYRVGDVFRCIGIGSKTEGNEIPRFQYIDRVPQVIDIAGFTRITENSINQAIKLSRLPIENWTAKKEFTPQNRPYMHLYVEMERTMLTTSAVSLQVLPRSSWEYISSIWIRIIRISKRFWALIR